MDAVPSPHKKHSTHLGDGGVASEPEEPTLAHEHKFKPCDLRALSCAQAQRHSTRQTIVVIPTTHPKHDRRALSTDQEQPSRARRRPPPPRRAPLRQQLRLPAAPYFVEN